MGLLEILGGLAFAGVFIVIVFVLVVVSVSVAKTLTKLGNISNVVIKTASSFFNNGTTPPFNKIITYILYNKNNILSII